MKNPARVLQDCFDGYYGEFIAITNRAKSRFEKHEWAAVISDAEERIGLYHHHLDLIEARMRELLGELVHDYELWEILKAEYWRPYLGKYHADLALIFFYSVMRRLYVETEESIQYSDDEIHTPQNVLDHPGRQPVRTYFADAVAPELIRRIVGDFSFNAKFLDLETDAALAARMFQTELANTLGSQKVERIEMLEPAFFRNKAAYLMGRVVAGDRLVPFVLVLLNHDDGIVIDSVLSDELDMSYVFTSARSNFHVDPANYREVLAFLESIAPTRPRAYVFTAIGFIHPGKLELVKELRHHLATTHEKFCTARGVPGTVMAVFELPTFRYVFKVIRDVSTKETFRGRRHVVGQYWRVHRMDRVGRMLDIMTFHNLRFARQTFDEALLAELLRDAPSSVWTENGEVVFRYLYAERQIAPLDVYLADPDIAPEAKSRAVIDYGHAIKDLAAAGIFVGDYMPKNFGVNRFGRVILYDYDDLDDIVNWNFRRMPEPPEWAEMLPYEDWLSKDDTDVFPEHDFRIFTVPGHERQTFMDHHADLIAPDFWNRIKGELQAGQVPDFCAYPEERRLRRE